MNLDAVLPLIGAILTAALVALLFFKRVFRIMPIFVAYLGFSVVSELAATAILVSPRARSSLVFWGANIVIDTLFYLCVVAEVGRNVLRYNRNGSPSSVLALALFLFAILLTSLLARWTGFYWRELGWQVYLRVTQSSAILEVAAILAIAWWGSLKKLRWPERELRMVTGMGFWAVVQFCVLIFHEHGFVGPQNHWLDFLTPFATLGVLIYWLYGFWLEPGDGTGRTWNSQIENQGCQSHYGR